MRRNTDVEKTWRSQFLLNPQSGFAEGEFEHRDGGWSRFLCGKPGSIGEADAYFVPLLPVDFHCHGVGRFDFTALRDLSLPAIELALAEEGIRCVLTVYLFHNLLDDLVRVMETFAVGDYNHIAGFALEGPLLSSSGGTPREAVWKPTRDEWRVIADCGRLGLRYVVMSPDASPPDETRWIASTLLNAGVRPALGHFRADSPRSSAEAISGLTRDLSSILPAGGLLSDHFLNDMPRTIKHAWRTARERESREAMLGQLRLDTWNLEMAEPLLGPVPAALLHAAQSGQMTLSLNFDGEHVDLAVCRRIVDLIGSTHVIAITDRVEGGVLGGRRLIPRPDNTLLYQESDIVAAGTQGLDRQMQNMRRIGLSEQQIWEMTCFVPSQILGGSQTMETREAPCSGCYVGSDRRRWAFFTRGEKP